MKSYQLWRALKNPPRQHPLFKYILTHAHKGEFKVTSGFFMWVFMCSTFTFFWTIVFDWLPYILLTALLAMNTFYSLRWVWRISGEIATEKENRRYDLLASLPFGMLGTTWAISTGCLHRRKSFRWMPYVVGFFVVAVCFTMFFTIGMTVLVMRDTIDNPSLWLANLDVLRLGIIAVPLIIGFYLDNLYSILTASLMGMAASVDVEYSTTAQIRGFFAFLNVQLIIYMIIAALIIYIMPPIINLLNLSMGWGIALQTIVGFTVFITLREMLVRWLWAYLMQNLNAETEEISLVLQTA